MHRIAAALVAEGLAVDEDGALRLGPRLVSLAFRAVDGSLLRQAAREPLSRLRDDLDETVHLAVPDFGEMVYIDKLESHRTVRMASRIGTRVSLHTSAVGKAWLATLPDSELAALLDRLALPARTPHSLTDRDSLRRAVAETRERGHSLDLQENELDICCYGRALRGAGARCSAASASACRAIASRPCRPDGAAGRCRPAPGRGVRGSRAADIRLRDANNRLASAAGRAKAPANRTGA